MELLVIVIIAFLIGKAFSGKKKKNQEYWPDEPIPYGAPKKKKGCLARIVTFLFWAMLVFIVVVFFSIMSDGMNTSSTTTESTAVPENKSKTVSSTDSPTAAQTEEPTVSPTAEPSTLQEWAETIAQRVYGRFDYQYTDLISVTCYQVDGDPAPMVEIYAKYPSSFVLDNDERMSNFLYNAKRVTQQLDELAKAGKIEYGSVLIHGRTNFVDKYGTETEGDAAQIRIKSKEAAKVTNWDNINSDYLPDLAVSFGIHTAIRDGLSYEYHSKIRN